MAKLSLAGKRVKLALVGAETLLGRELQEILEARPGGASIRTFAASGEGNFAGADGEAVYLEPLEAASVRECEAILVAGSEAGAMKAYEIAKAASGHPAVIDCTGELEQQPEARLVAPLAGDTGEGAASWLLVVAHPAATAIALVLKKMASYKPLKQAVVEIFEPASERGKRGISELQQQTTSLLAFKPLDKQIFDAQASFNMLAQYGADAALKLSSVEQRIERHLASILSRQKESSSLPMPSLRLIQAPVFHGYSVSVWVEFDGNVDAEELGQALASAQIEIRGDEDEAPNNVGAASQSGLVAGDIRVDRNNRRAAWLWIVGDNLRLVSDNAAEVVNRLAAERA